jgi:hypothetical protein
MSINKQRPNNQLELFEKPRILVMTLLIERATFYCLNPLNVEFALCHEKHPHL